MENDLISVIVPVYNVEKYLERCVESIEENTYKNLEVIIGEDGSTDGSKAVAKRLAEKHRPQGLEQNKKVARMGGHAAKVAREDIEKNLGETIVTKQNRLNYEYKDSLELDEKNHKK